MHGSKNVSVAICLRLNLRVTGLYLCVICIDVLLQFMMSEDGTKGKCVHAEFNRAEKRALRDTI